ncbi:hypothetical protein GCM10009755_16650 [Brevibacterium samyangense]|uniref:Uncharacterized protein n=1 Tax=Brevibacterium samyangense TaxID=366888 RepID=A0ABN2TER3_9MICO
MFMERKYARNPSVGRVRPTGGASEGGAGVARGGGHGTARAKRITQGNRKSCVRRERKLIRLPWVKPWEERREPGSGETCAPRPQRIVVDDSFGTRLKRVSCVT